MSRSQSILIAAVVLLIVGLVLVFTGVLPGLKSSLPRGGVSIEFWTFEDDERLWRDIIKEFEEQYAHIRINVRRIDPSVYENTLLNRLAEGTGPDVFMLQNSGLVKNKGKIFPLPQSAFQFTPRDYQRVFVDAAFRDLVDNDGNILGLPLSMDTLALFYNRDIFNAEGISEPPKTWDDVIDVSRTITKKNALSDVTRSGIALGRSENVEHAFEIVSALILQNGGVIIDEEKKAPSLGAPANDAFEFYTSFADRSRQNFSWTSAYKNSQDAFAEGEAGMALGFLSDVRLIRAKNPHLDFDIALFPQLKDARFQSAIARYPFLTVSQLSKNKGSAWQFALALVSKETSRIYLEKAGRAPARRDLITSAPADQELEIFHRQALIAETWPIPDYDAARALFLDAISAINSKSKLPNQAVNELADRLELLIP